MSLDFAAEAFAYVIVGANGRGLYAVFDGPPTRHEPGRLTRLLKEHKLASPHLNIRSVVWLPAHMPFWPPTFLWH